MLGIAAFIESLDLVHTTTFVAQASVSTFLVPIVRFRSTATWFSRAFYLLSFAETWGSIRPPIWHDWDILRPPKHCAASVHLYFFVSFCLCLLPESIVSAIKETLSGVGVNLIRKNLDHLRTGRAFLCCPGCSLPYRRRTLTSSYDHIRGIQQPPLTSFCCFCRLCRECRIEYRRFRHV